jgi:hypothetical protein
MPRVTAAAVLVTTVLAGVRAGAQQSAAPPTVELDYAFFRDKVQPILLHKRENLARCYVCHSQGTPFQLQPLTPSSTMWDEEQSRRNFDAVRKVVVPGDTTKSLLLLMPLAESAGGTPFHPGGKHFQSQSDPEWQTLAAWVKGARE